MDIKYALLGFLNWQPATGYELGKLIRKTIGFEWSGNNNQIYKSLIELRRDGMVESETMHEENTHIRKVYTITEPGKRALKQRMVETPELPVIKKDILIQLAWSDQLGNTELITMLSRYRQAVETELLLIREQVRRGAVNPSRSSRERYLWHKIAENCVTGFETELAWVSQLITDITNSAYWGAKR